ncbi:MAG TPA: DUF3344 domain-containing protein [Caldimonas sp.]|jgi:hypothetical protein|nr:DUF3344 domain-containing protein [Caldimonas sp.]HEX2541103.1 DUF3344 domain-containing protein [Caldimonas sp.]
MSLPRFVAACAALLVAGAGANDLQNFTTVQNTDWTQAGVGGMRGLGSGSITLAGVTGTVTQAYLYWAGPTNSASPTANASVLFGGTSILGTNIGFSQDNFWGFENSQAYRADVTALVSGNGVYSLANFTKPGVEVNGASLIVFFNDGNSANNRDVVLFDGNDANFPNPFDAPGWNSSLAGINYTSGSAALSLHVSDGQDFSGPDDGTLLLNNIALASGDIFQGNTLPSAGGGVSNGNLWDIRTFDVTSFLAPGPNTLNFRMGELNDALGLIVAAVDLPAGAAPPVSAIPEPETYALMLAGLAAIRLVSRRRKA